MRTIEKRGASLVATRKTKSERRRRQLVPVRRRVEGLSEFASELTRHGRAVITALPRDPARILLYIGLLNGEEKSFDDGDFVFASNSDWD